MGHVPGAGPGRARHADRVRAANHRHQGGDGAPPAGGRAAPPAEAGQDQQPAGNGRGVICSTCLPALYLLQQGCQLQRWTVALQAEAAADAMPQAHRHVLQVSGAGYRSLVASMPVLLGCTSVWFFGAQT